MEAVVHVKSERGAYCMQPEFKLRQFEASTMPLDPSRWLIDLCSTLLMQMLRYVLKEHHPANREQ